MSVAATEVGNDKAMLVSRRGVRAFALSLTFMVCLAGPASAAVVVSYGDPDRSTDAGNRSTDQRDVAAELARHFRQLGDRYLRPGDELRIWLLDVDRAGSPRMNLPNEVRVVSGDSDFPCIELSFTFASNGRNAQAARERVCDQRFLLFRRADLRYSPNDPLVYEKVMLDNWFQNRFGANRHAP